MGHTLVTVGGGEPVFKDDHHLSDNDTGNDLCNVLDMIVQVQLRTLN